MTWQFGAGPDNLRPVCGYMRLTVAYDATSNKVTLRGHGRAVLDTLLPMSEWRIRNIPGGNALDSWLLS